MLSTALTKSRYLPWLLAALIFCAALYRYWPVHIPVAPCGIGYESLQTACSLVSQGSFADPFKPMPTGPSAHMAPLFPLLISLLIRWFGNTPQAVFALQWMGALVVALQLSLWPVIARRLGMNLGAGALAVVAWLFAYLPLSPMWESVYVGLLMVVLAYAMRCLLTEHCSTAFVLFTAVLWGITFLFTPVVLFCYVALMLWIWFSSIATKAQKLALIAIPLLTVSPWLVRNRVVFHHFVFVRDNIGLELALSNNPCAGFSFRGNQASNCYNHPNEVIEQTEQVRALGEYQYNQAKVHEAFTWIREHPARFAELTEQRTVAFWFPNATGNPLQQQRLPPGVLLIWVLSLISLPGLWLLWWHNREAAAMCVLWLVLFPPIYYLVQFDFRYRYPVLWATFLPAGFFITVVVKRIWKALQPSSATLQSVPEASQQESV